jgi:hypothetical protein
MLPRNGTAPDHHGVLGYRNPWPSAHAPLAEYVPTNWRYLPIDFARPLDMTGLKSIKAIKPDFAEGPTTDDERLRATWIGHAVRGGFPFVPFENTPLTHLISPRNSVQTKNRPFWYSSRGIRVRNVECGSYSTQCSQTARRRQSISGRGRDGIRLPVLSRSFPTSTLWSYRITSTASSIIPILGGRS